MGKRLGKINRCFMEKYEEILEKLNGLGISVRKMIKENRELLEVQKEVVLKLRQEELMQVMVSMNSRMGGLEEEVWLDKAGVISYLNISRRTFERRVKTKDWKRKRNADGWVYLKSELVR